MRKMIDVFESSGLVVTEANNQERDIEEAKLHIEKKTKEFFDSYKILQIEQANFVKYDETKDKYEFEVKILTAEKVII